MALAFWLLFVRQRRVFLRVFSGVLRLVGCIWRGIVLGLAIGVEHRDLLLNMVGKSTDLVF